MTISKNVMNVFELRESVLNDYSKFATSFTKISDLHIKDQVEKIYKQGKFWPEPMIQINPSYKSAGSIDEIAKTNDLHAKISRIFCRDGRPLNLYKHQSQALGVMQSLLATRPNEIMTPAGGYVVTTGTGSGKSLCFFVPMVDYILKQKENDLRPRTRAIVIYPMNALANSQLEEVNGYLRNLSPNDRGISVAIYTGQEDQAKRDQVVNNPPDILLTNFMMLELLLTRQDETDQRVVANCRDIDFLVLDELHTYRGRQGADVAMLLRRIRSTLSPRVICVGTSATMVSDDETPTGADEQGAKQQIVAEVASKLFGAPIKSSDVIQETLERKTDANKTLDNIKSELIESVQNPLAESITDAELKGNALAVWVELTLGMKHNSQHVLVRATPRTLSDVVNELARDTDCTQVQCKNALTRLLLIANKPESDRGIVGGSTTAFFAFKLHQFIAGAGAVYSTLEKIGTRRLTVDAQVFMPETDEMRLYGTYFCR